MPPHCMLGLWESTELTGDTPAAAESAGNAGGSVSTGARSESNSESTPGVHWMVSPG